MKTPALLLLVTGCAFSANPAAAQMGLEPYAKQATENRWEGDTLRAMNRVPCGALDRCRVCRQERVVDAVTLELNCGGPKRVTVRLAGLKAPATDAGARCEKERERGALAVRYLSQMFLWPAEVDLIDLGQGIDGETIGLVRYDGRDVGGDLMWHGHARAISATGEPPNWCP